MTEPVWPEMTPLFEMEPLLGVSAGPGAEAGCCLAGPQKPKSTISSLALAPTFIACDDCDRVSPEGEQIMGNRRACVVCCMHAPDYAWHLHAQDGTGIAADILCTGKVFAHQAWLVKWVRSVVAATCVSCFITNTLLTCAT